MGEVQERDEDVKVLPRNIPVPLFIDQVMQNDLAWFVEHFKEQRPASEDVSVADVIYDMLDDVIDVWADDHSHTGVCYTCREGVT